jgi:hypothetical protein
VGCIFLVDLGDRGLPVVTVMNENAITKLQLLALLNRPAPVLLRVVIELSPAEGIGGEQAITACVPVSGMAETPRTVEDGNAQFFSLDRTVLVDPIRALSPDCFSPSEPAEFTMCAGGEFNSLAKRIPTVPSLVSPRVTSAL